MSTVSRREALSKFGTMVAVFGCGIVASPMGARAQGTPTQECGYTDPSSAISVADADCSPAQEGGDADCGSLSNVDPLLYHMDNDCLEGQVPATTEHNRDLDCGRAKVGSHTHNDSDCGHATQAYKTEDNDCGKSASSGVNWADSDCASADGSTSHYTDNDCSPSAESDQDCGTTVVVSGEQRIHNDGDDSTRPV